MTRMTTPSPQSVFSCDVVPQSRGFTLIELLVVISLVSLLMAILLPALERARDSAREAKCASNMRQVFILSELFRADRGVILPSAYYPKYPSGVDGNNVPTDAGKLTSYTHMLINMGYLSESERIPWSGLATTSNFKLLSDHAKGNRVLSCPNMWTGHSLGNYDTRPQSTPNHIDNDIDRRSAAFFYTVGYIDEPVQPVRYGMFTGYQVNVAAGGHHFYQFQTLPNNGYYARKQWKSGSDSKIAYLFEDFFNLSGAKWQYVDSITLTSYSWGGYGPPVRHNGYTGTNLIFADGHREHLKTPEYVTHSEIPFELQ